MKIQSLSVQVPGGCPNKCKFCVADLHSHKVKNQIEQNTRFRDLYERDFIQRLNFARDNGCNVCMLTGDGEPLINERFLNDFTWMNEKLNNPFIWIELQTSGVTLNDEKLRWLRNKVNVSTISLSLSSVFCSDKNAEYNGTPDRFKIYIDKLCDEIKRYDFNLRLSLNLTDAYSDKSVSEIFERCKQLKADQVTFRVLYQSDFDSPVNEWISKHTVSPEYIQTIKNFIKLKGRFLEVLPFGATRYSVYGMSAVLDGDCMSTMTNKDVVKYLILRPDCKLYTKWDDLGSILF